MLYADYFGNLYIYEQMESSCHSGLGQLVVPCLKYYIQNVYILVPTPHNSTLIMEDRDKHFKVLMLFSLDINQTKFEKQGIL